MQTTTMESFSANICQMPDRGLWQTRDLGGVRSVYQLWKLFWDSHVSPGGHHPKSRFTTEMQHFSPSAASGDSVWICPSVSFQVVVGTLLQGVIPLWAVAVVYQQHLPFLFPSQAAPQRLIHHLWGICQTQEQKAGLVFSCEVPLVTLMCIGTITSGVYLCNESNILVYV